MIGRRLAHYDITGHLGSGGMGDVYQATDSKLGRDVALKFLPEAGTGDPDRAARFAREAKALAALNHSNIAAVYGLEEAEGRRFLVMELVPGQTLADRIRRGAVPVDEAVGIARQIGQALEAAHEKGIVHRDLKPANVKITPDGQVKVLDFGLAKLVLEKSSPGLGDSPTIGSPATRTGMILGTPAYMAPEQAMGRPVDRRADIFAFGCVLYEMLAGRQPFDGESVAEVLSRVLERDPDWKQLPASTPPALHRLLRLCLEKDAKQRRQTAADVRIDLDHALSEPITTAPPAADRGSRVARLAWIVGASAAIAVLAIPTITHFRERPADEMRLQIVTPPTRWPLSFALAPDGRSVVFVASGESPSDPDRLPLQSFAESDARPLSGTEGARQPFWSPDSRSIGFFASGKLARIDVNGGRPQVLAPASAPQWGAWAPDGTILFAPDTVSPLFRLPSAGGDAVAATKIEAPRQTNHRRPSFLSDGRHYLFHVAGAPEVSGLYVGSLDGGTPKRLGAADAGATFLAPDRVLFLQQGTLVARRYDTARRELVGDSVTVATGVGEFSVSATGIVAHRARSPMQSETMWVNRKGEVLQRGGLAFVNGPELSPDDQRLAGDRTVDGNRDIWVVDLVRGGLTRFTTHPAVDGFPLWSPDGARIAFHSSRNGTIDLWIKPSSGASAEQLLLEAPDSEWPIDWSRDGQFLLYQKSDLKAGWDLWALPMTGSDRTPIAVAKSPFAERLGEFSRNGDFVVYETDESGRPEVVAQAFPEPGGRWPISTHGGAAPRWSVDGTEIYFTAPDGTLMAVPVTIKGAHIEAGLPAVLFSAQVSSQTFKFQYAVSSDGRFVINRVLADLSAPPINVILNLRF